jgi:hypothetical protein
LWNDTQFYFLMIAYPPRADAVRPVPLYAVPVLIKRDQPVDPRSAEVNRYKNLANECREHFAHQGTLLNNMRDALQTAQHMITTLSQELQVARAFSRTLEQRVTLLEASMPLSSTMTCRNVGERDALTVSADHLNGMLTTVLTCIEDEKFMSKEKEMLSLLEDA